MVDLDGSGIPSLVTMESPTPGTFLREGDDWGSFRPFHELPNVDWQSAQVKHVDLDGDGRDDLLVVTRDSYVWYPSLGRDGYGEPRRFPRSNEDDDRGPDVPFYANGHGAQVVLADMTGDGLADLVQVTHSQVRYWPGLGHGKFGAMVVMTRSPFLEPPGEFDGRRVGLADLDGHRHRGPLVLRRQRDPNLYEQAGNSFTEQPTRVTSFPTEEGLRTVGVGRCLRSRDEPDRVRASEHPRPWSGSKSDRRRGRGEALPAHERQEPPWTGDQSPVRAQHQVLPG